VIEALRAENPALVGEVKVVRAENAELQGKINGSSRQRTPLRRRGFVGASPAMDAAGGKLHRRDGADVPAT
jgi:hypothetical protein